MPSNKKIHVMCFGPGRAGDSKVEHSVDDIMQAVKQAAGKSQCSPVGAHGSFARPHQVPPGHPDDAEATGAVAGADILCAEVDLEKITAALSQIPNIQFEVAEAA